VSRFHVDSQIVDRMAVIKEYALKTLQKCHGEDTRMCDIRTHFRNTRPEMQDHITDKMFSNSLMNVAHMNPDWADIVEYDKDYTDQPTKCEIYRNLTFIDPDVKDTYAVFKIMQKKSVGGKKYTVFKASPNDAVAKHKHSDQ